MPRVRDALARGRARLAATASAALDTELLLAEALGRRRTWLHAWPEAELDDTAAERFQELLSRRAAGEPIAYILGRREFWSLELAVTPAVLIPRPESEGLVEAALTDLRARGIAAPRVLDLGTGSGCMAIAIARERPDARVTAVEADPHAIAVARTNTERHGCSNLRLVEGDWLEPIGEERFDVIVANPPYVASGDPHLVSGDLRFEPRRALDGGPDGLDALRRIAADAPAHLAEGGLLAVEHGADQAQAVVELFRDAGLVEVGVQPDAAGLARITLGRAAGERASG